MLYVNGVFLNTNKKDGDLANYVRDYHDKVEQLRLNYGKYVFIESKKRPKINKTGKMEAIPASSIPMRTIVSGENGTEDWVYTKSTPIIKDGILKTDDPQLVIYNGELTIDLEKEPDLAYFLLYKHVFFTGNNPKYHIHDEKKIAKSKAESRRNMLKLDSAIYGESSPLNVSHLTLETVAKRWGISVANMTKDEIQNALHDKVSLGEKTLQEKGAGRGISEFLEDIKVKDDVKVGALINEALEKSIIKFNPRYNRFETNTDDGTEGSVLTNVAVKDLDRKVEVLIDRANTDPIVKRRIENAMGREETTVDTLSFDAEEIRDSKNYQFLQSCAGQIGIKAIGVPKEELRQNIIDEIKAREGAV